MIIAEASSLIDVTIFAKLVSTVVIRMTPLCFIAITGADVA